MRRGLSLTFMTVALTALPASASELTVTVGTPYAPCQVTKVGTTGPLTAGCAYGYSDQTTQVALSATSAAAANYGNIGVFAALALSSLQGTAASGQINAYAAYDDNFSITNLNQDAFLATTVSLEGSSVEGCSYAPTGGECGYASVEYITQIGGISGPTCILNAAGSCTVEVPIIPFDGFASAGIAGSVVASVSAGIGGVDGIVSPVAGYLDTAMVDSLLIVDANGNPIPGVNIVSDSGTDYNAIPPDNPTTAAPEPSSLALLGTSLIVMAASVRRHLSS